MKLAEKRIQLWPSGQSVDIRGDPDEPGFRIKTGKRWRPVNIKMHRLVKIELLAEMYVNRDILVCDTPLVCDLMDQGVKGFSVEEIANYYTNPDAMDEDECKRWLKDRSITPAEDDLDGLRECIRENAEPSEVYEWYRVNDWLAGKLKEIGECVLDNDYGYWWGRCASGQMLIMDGTIQKIAAKFAA